MRETAPVADDDDGHDDDTVYSDAGDGSDSEPVRQRRRTDDIDPFAAVSDPSLHDIGPHRPVSAEFLNPDLPPGVLQESHWNPLYGGLT